MHTSSSSEAVKSVKKPKHQPRDDMTTKGGRPSPSLICADPVSVTIWSLPRESSVDSSNTESLREMPGGFSDLANLRDGGSGQSKLSQNSSPFDSCAPQTSFDFSKAARHTQGEGTAAGHAGWSNCPALSCAQKTAEAGPSTALQRTENTVKWHFPAGWEVGNILRPRRGGWPQQTGRLPGHCYRT